MPTVIGHAISGFAVGSLAPSRYWKRAGLLSAVCSIAPDIDALAFKLGIPYEHWLGHRGFTHSLSFAALIASLAFLFMRRAEPFGGKRSFLWVLFFSSAVLHDLLDALTNGGLGVAFFSPFDTTRYFLPWHPIEVSPLSIKRFFSPRGSTVLLSEFSRVVLPSLLVIAGLYMGKNKKVPASSDRPGPVR